MITRSSFLCALIATPAIAAATTGTLLVEEDSVLAEDHFGDIVIVADDVRLDCGGHAVVGPGDGDGVSVTGRRNVIVRRCHVEGFSRGFSLEDSTGSRLEHNSAQNCSLGILLVNSHDNALVGNRVVENSEGIVVSASNGNDFRTNRAINNTAGFDLVSSSKDNVFRDNAAVENSGPGFIIDDGSSDNLLRSNRSDANSVGFDLLPSSARNMLLDNVAQGNEFAGFVMAFSDGNILVRNSARGNAVRGFIALDSLDLILRDNTSRGHSDQAFVLAGVDGGTLIGNRAGGSLTGFEITSSQKVVVSENAADDNGDGFAIVSVTASEFKANTAFGNAGIGLDIVGSSDNGFARNEACSNGTVDAAKDAASLNNRFIRNRFCTTDGF